MIIALFTSADTNSLLSVTTIIIPTLFAIIVIGLAALRFRSPSFLGKPSDDSGDQMATKHKIGVDELLPELQSFYNRSAFVLIPATS